MHSTLNEEFRCWLERFAAAEQGLERHDEVMNRLRGRLRVGLKLTRDEMIER